MSSVFENSAKAAASFLFCGLDAIRDDAIDSLGYFLKPSELFSSIVKRTDSIIEELETILNNIEQSTMGSKSADDFGNLFTP